MVCLMALYGEVWYVPGWLRCHDPGCESMDALGAMFPQASVRYYDWEGNSLHWPRSLAQADQTARALQEELSGMSREERERVVLVGHSLGGRIVTRVLAGLSRQGLRVGQGVLLGAAIPYDDEDVFLVGGGSVEPVLNFINPSDMMLKYCYGLMGGESRPALGANGALAPLGNYRERVVSFPLLDRVDFELYVMKFAIVRRIANHHAKFYLQRWAEDQAGEEPEEEAVVVPQDQLNLRIATLGGRFFWKDLEECQGWRLQQNLVTGHCRILNPENHRLAWGEETVMRRAFQKVKYQLESRESPSESRE
ncbi:MAG: alpha/beta fold hydrolase [Oligosphaeraceae bacterium]